MKAAKRHISWYNRPWLVVIIGLALLAAGLYLIHLFRPSSEPQIKGSCTVKGVTTHENQVYAARSGFESRATSLDLYLPERQGSCSESLPLIVWVHGGSFTGGDKASGIEYKKKLFTDQGWALASVEYRLTSPVRSVPHPAQANDVASALGWLQENRQRYHLDTEQTMLVGFSAGAYLVSLISTDNEYVSRENFPPRNIICTVSLDTGAYDLPRYMQSDDGAVGVYTDVLGHDAGAWQRRSPLHLALSAQHLPAFLLVTVGEGIRPAISHAFGEALRKKHVQAKVFEANPYTHGDLDGRFGMPDDELLTPEVTRFLQKCSAHKQRSSTTMNPWAL